MENQLVCPSRVQKDCMIIYSIVFRICRSPKDSPTPQHCLGQALSLLHMPGGDSQTDSKLWSVCGGISLGSSSLKPGL